MSYLGFIILTLAIGGVATGWCKHQLSKYSQVAAATGMSGAAAATQMLRYYGVNMVPVRAGGNGQDFFDPRSNAITLSPEAYGRCSVTALATACHEVGHACQYAQGYAPMKIRGALVPAVNFCSNAWMIILIAGIFLNLAGLVDAAIIMYVAVVLFQLVTLPVEFDASKRALAYMDSALRLPADQRGGAKSVLTACALTYVAAALTSILQLLWLLGQRDE